LNEQCSIPIFLATIQTAKLAIEQLQSHVIMEKDQLFMFKSEVERQRKEANSAKARAKELDEYLLSVNTAHKNAEKKIKSEFEEIRSNLHTEDQWHEIQRALNESKNALRVSKEDLLRKANQLQSVQNSLSKYQNECSNLKDLVDQKEARLNRLKQSLISKDNLIANIKPRLEEKEAVVQKLQQQVQSLMQIQDRYKQLQLELQTKESMIKEYRSQNEKQNAAMQESIEYKKRYEELHAVLLKTKQELESKHEKLIKVKTKADLFDEINSSKGKLHHNFNTNRTD
jgi:chromosome segregation ATPase